MSNLQFFLIADPGTKTVFAMLFVAYNPYTQEIFILDEIYERNPLYTSTQSVWKQAQAKIEAITGPDSVNRWTKIYDSAAAWFSTEMAAQFSVGFAPCQKLSGDKEEGLGLIKDLFNTEGAIQISDLCNFFCLEISRYKTDKMGRVPDGSDHLIDCFRYFLNWIGYRFQKKVKAGKPPIEKRRRAFSMEEDVRRMRRRRDWTEGIMESY